MLGWVGCHAFPNVIAPMQSSDSPPPSAEAPVPLAPAYLKDELLFLTDGCASSQAFPSLGDWSPGLPSPGSCFEERSGPPRFLGRPLTPCHGRPPRRIRDHLAHRSVIMMLPSGIPRPWASGTVCVSRLHSRGPIVRLPTHRRGDYPPSRKAGFRLLGSALVGQDSHLLDDRPNFQKVAPPSFPSDQPAWSLLVLTLPFAVL